MKKEFSGRFRLVSLGLLAAFSTSYSTAHLTYTLRAVQESCDITKSEILVGMTSTFPPLRVCALSNFLGFSGSSTNNLPLVMVSYNPAGKSHLPKLLKNVISMQNGTLVAEFSEAGALIVANVSLQLRESLAGLVHNHTPDRLPCGNLEDIQSLSLTTLDLGTLRLGPKIADDRSFEAIAAAVDTISADDIMARIQYWSSTFPSRYHSTGTAVSDAVTSRWQELIQGKDLGATIVESTALGSGITQKNVVLRFEGTTAPEEIVILGAHLDSIHSADNSNAPGADDNASGLAGLEAVIKVIADHSIRFERTVEMHAYAAEEIGLVGSKKIAGEYAEDSVKIAGMMQLDMTGYSDNNVPKVFLIENDTSPLLQRSLKELNKSYVKTAIEGKTLSGGTSDHKSWTLQGYPAVFAFENPKAYNPYLHSASDTTANVNSPELALNITRLGAAFLLHWGGGQGLDGSELSGSTRSSPAKVLGSMKLSTVSAGNGTYHLGVSVEADLDRIEVCKTLEDTPSVCGSEIIVLEKVAPRAGRSYFANSQGTPVSFVSGDYLRVKAYQTQDGTDTDSDTRLVKLIISE